jgi:hypothetical protein
MMTIFVEEASQALRSDAVHNVEKISAAAMGVFAKRGLARVTADVAERAGVGCGHRVSQFRRQAAFCERDLA